VTADSEFAFELRVCAWAERAWPPGADGGSDEAVLVARQLGVRERRWDTIVFECDRAGLERRANFGHEHLDADLLHVLRNAPAEWQYYRDVLPDPGYSWSYVREAIHEASDRDILESRKRSNRIEIRRKWAYPDWIDRIVAIENKPDLTATAARDLAPQVERDVALGLADEVWIATAATGERVEPILLEDVPLAAGVLTVDADAGSADVSWQPQRLAVDEPGTRILENPAPSTTDQSAARFEYVDTDWKEYKRLQIAERAYERGWRAYADTMRPDCRHFEVTDDPACLLPHCAAKAKTPTAGECSHRCAAFEPEPPAWRNKGWPIEGGPGKGLKRLLADRRNRRRPGLD